jgi:excisionase family DNA binding protein
VVGDKYTGLEGARIGLCARAETSGKVVNTMEKLSSGNCLEADKHSRSPEALAEAIATVEMHLSSSEIKRLPRNAQTSLAVVLRAARNHLLGVVGAGDLCAMYQALYLQHGKRSHAECLRIVQGFAALQGRTMPEESVLQLLTQQDSSNDRTSEGRDYSRVTEAEARKALGISPELFMRWTERGYLRAVRRGNGDLVVTGQELERQLRLQRLATICRIDAEWLHRWIAGGLVDALELAGHHTVTISSEYVEAIPDDLFFSPPSRPPEEALEPVEFDGEEHWLTVEDAAKALGLSQATVRRWIRSRYMVAARTTSGDLVVHRKEILRNKALESIANMLGTQFGRTKLHEWIAEGTVTAIQVQGHMTRIGYDYVGSSTGASQRAINADQQSRGNEL